jgi:hypothetical protein
LLKINVFTQSKVDKQVGDRWLGIVCVVINNEFFSSALQYPLQNKVLSKIFIALDLTHQAVARD